MSGLTTEQYGLLEVLTYLDDEAPFKRLMNAKEGQTIGSFLESIDIDSIKEDYTYHSYITGSDWKQIIDYVLKDEKLKNMKIKATHRDRDFGGESVLFICDKKGEEEAVTAFRGTAPAEWTDNIEGAALNSKEEPETKCQEKALAWYQDIYEKHELDKYPNRTVIGHSKGGNKAKFITIKDPSVTKCVSFDGQGFSDEFIDKYKNEIKMHEKKISNHNVDHDFVNILLNDVGEKTFYKGFLRENDGFHRNHCPNVFFNPNLKTPNMEKNAEGRDTLLTVGHDFLNSFCRTLSPEAKKKTIGTIATTVSSLFRQLENNKLIDQLVELRKNREKDAVSDELRSMRTNPAHIACDNLLKPENTKNVGKLIAYGLKYVEERFKKDKNLEKQVKELARKKFGWFAGSIAWPLIKRLPSNGFCRAIFRRFVLKKHGVDAKGMETFTNLFISAGKEDTSKMEIKDGNDLDIQKLIKEGDKKKLDAVTEQLEAEASPLKENVKDALVDFRTNIELHQFDICKILEENKEKELSKENLDEVTERISKILAYKSLQKIVEKNAAHYTEDLLDAMTSKDTINKSVEDIKKSEGFKTLMAQMNKKTLESIASDPKGEYFPQDSVEQLYNKFLQIIAEKTAPAANVPAAENAPVANNAQAAEMREPEVGAVQAAMNA